ncbi:MAG: glycosyl transferase [Atribacterota bacterium]|nr:glycosyl transferase [Atribacterota bacterium]
MNYGYFDKENNEYVVTRPDTPTPWINYLGQGKYGGIISATAGGYSFYRDPRNCRVTRYRYNGVPMDRPGRYIYIRDQETGEYFSPSWNPVQKDLDRYECRHGLGYTRITGELGGIEGSTTYFVPKGKDFEIWRLLLKNKSKRKRVLHIFSYAEFCFFDAIMDQQNVDWVQQIMRCEFKNDIIYFHRYDEIQGFSFFFKVGKMHSYDCGRDQFLGLHGHEGRPLALKKGECSNSQIFRANGVAATCTEITLDPGEEKEFLYFLGKIDKREDAVRIQKTYGNSKSVEVMWKELNEYWKELISHFHADTPDEKMNLMLNTWNQYQDMVTFNWSRFVSMYQLGISRGLGTRDSNQDTLGVMHTIPEQAKELIVRLLKIQFPEGDAYHQFFPLTGQGDGSGFSDDHLWYVLSVSSYLKETGNIGFLKKILPFADGKGSASVYEHLFRAVDFSMNKKVGLNDLPLIGEADWNDTLNLDKGNGRAESIFTANLLGVALQEISEIAHQLGKEKDEKNYKGWYSKIKNRVNEVAWDGKWYIRAFDDFGGKIGSQSSKKGKFYLNAQVWSVLSGFAEKERAVQIMDLVYERLNTKHGIILSEPPYEGFNEKIGGTTTFPPGAKENSGIFCHTNPWAVIAETILRRGDRAFMYYSQILPPKWNNKADSFEIEPYVYCQNILGKHHPQFGLGRNSWLTGTASWNFVAAVYYILGIRPSYQNLIIDPCIPSRWDGFTCWRWFRGKLFNIQVENPDGRCTAEPGRLFLNGKEIKGNRILLGEANKENEVRFIM